MKIDRDTMLSHTNTIISHICFLVMTFSRSLFLLYLFFLSSAAFSWASVLVGLQRGKQPCLSSGSKLLCFSAFSCCSLASPFLYDSHFHFIFLLFISLFVSIWFSFTYRASCLKHTLLVLSNLKLLFFMFCDFFLTFALLDVFVLVKSICLSLLFYFPCSFVHRLTHLKVRTRVRWVWYFVFWWFCFWFLKDFKEIWEEGLAVEVVLGLKFEFLCKD